MGMPLTNYGDFLRISSQARHITVSAAWELFFSQAVGSGRWSEGSQYNAKHAAERWFSDLAFAKKHLAALTIEDILRLSIRLRMGVSAAWYNRERSLFRSFVRWCLKFGLCSQDVSSIWEPEREGDPERMIGDFSREELSMIAAHLPPPAWRFLWAAVYTGLRSGQLVGPKAVTWRMVDSDWILHYPLSMLKQGQSLRTRGRTTYDLPISSALRGILVRGDPDEPILPGISDRSTLSRQLKEAARKAGIDPRRMFPHNLRRTTCRLLREAGVTLEQARELLGWSGNSVILLHYWPPQSSEEARRIVDLL